VIAATLGDVAPRLAAVWSPAPVVVVVGLALQEFTAESLPARKR
jgi:hypothetical protein